MLYKQQTLYIFNLLQYFFIYLILAQHSMLYLSLRNLKLVSNKLLNNEGNLLLLTFEKSHYSKFMMLENTEIVFHFFKCQCEPSFCSRLHQEWIHYFNVTLHLIDVFFKIICIQIPSSATTILSSLEHQSPHHQPCLLGKCHKKWGGLETLK